MTGGMDQMFSLCGGDVECSGDVWERCWSSFDCNFEGDGVAPECEPYAACAMDACRNCEATALKIDTACAIELDDIDAKDLGGLLSTLCVDACLDSIFYFEASCPGIAALSPIGASQVLEDMCVANDLIDDEPELESFDAVLAITGFSFDYYEANQDDVEAHLLRDLSLLLGVDRELITINNISRGSLIVNFTVVDSDEVNLNRVYDGFNTNLENESLEFPALTVLAEKNPDAKEGDAIGVDNDRSNTQTNGGDDDDEIGVISGAGSATPSVLAIALVLVGVFL
jgi:hypothetical protein